jgi:hypothetical protein
VETADRPRREKTLAHHPDLVLDLPLLPARGRRAGGWLVSAGAGSATGQQLWPITARGAVY